MNFRTDQGYETTVSVFESLGLSINDRNPTAEPPASSQYPTSHLAYPSQSPANIQGRNSSAQLPIAQAAANPGMMPISNFANSAIVSYTDRVPHANTQDSYPVTSRQVMTTGNTRGLSSPSFPTHATISPGGELRPTNSQSYHPPPVSHFVQGAAHMDCSTSSNSVIRSSNSYGNEARPAILQDKYLSALRDIIPTDLTSNMLPSTEFTISRPKIENQPTRSQNNGMAAWGSITYEGPNTSIMPSSEFTTRAATSCGNEFRPTSSAPEPYRDRSPAAPLSLSQMLPPKRVLPFPTKPANPKAAISSTPHELPAADTSPAKRRKTTSKPVASTEAPAADTRKRIAKDGHQQPETGIVANEAPTDISSATQTLLEASELGSTTIPSNTKTTPKPRAKSTPKPRKSAVPKSGTKQFATGSPPRRSSPKPSSSTSTREEPSRSLFGDGISPAEFMSRLDAWVREYQHLPAPKPRDLIAENRNNLAAYAAQPREERMAIIDDLICECLGDESFVKLLEDVEQSWRRIGLGI